MLLVYNETFSNGLLEHLPCQASKSGCTVARAPCPASTLAACLRLPTPSTALQTACLHATLAASCSTSSCCAAGTHPLLPAGPRQAQRCSTSSRGATLAAWNRALLPHLCCLKQRQQPLCLLCHSVQAPTAPCRYVLTQFNSTSLNTHITSSYPPAVFGAVNRQGYVDVLAATQTPQSQQWYKGSADAVRRNLPMILDSIRGGGLPDELLVLSGQALYRMVKRCTCRLQTCRPCCYGDWWEDGWCRPAGH